MPSIPREEVPKLPSKVIYLLVGFKFCQESKQYFIILVGNNKGLLHPLLNMYRLRCHIDSEMYLKILFINIPQLLTYFMTTSQVTKTWHLIDWN